MANHGEYVTIGQVVDLIGLRCKPGQPRDGVSIDVVCPFCGKDSRLPQYKLNIDLANDVYRCNKCGESGNAIDLYGRCVHGERCIPGRNSKRLYRQLCEDVRQPRNVPVGAPTATKSTRPSYKRIERAPDELVSKVYKALLRMPEFALIDAHRHELLKRGLSERTIKRNGYRSFHPGASLSIAPNGNVGKEISRRLLAQGLKLEGVPGFYKKNGYWTFVYEDGLVIPTLNQKGQIVSLQLRKESGELRYKTISSKNYGGVNVGISRAHFPMGNAAIGPNTVVLLTEGPLKADVTLELLKRDDVALIAVQGVNNTADLPGIFQSLRELGVRRVYNALDMDKLTNINVGKASKKIKELAHKAKLGMPALLWGSEDAVSKLMELEDVCEQLGIRSRTRNVDVFHQIIWLAKKIPADVMKDHNEWPKTSKGIDDYCMSLTITPSEG